jgi:MFS family permease
MPLVFITYSLAYLDRANYGLAAAAGMAQDLRITQGMSSLIGSLFLLGYFAFQIPGAIYAERYSVRRLIIASMVVWGLCSGLTGVISNVSGLLVIRFVMGIAEAAVMPAMLIYIARWFTRSERSMANTLFILGNPVTVLWMSILSGYLIDAFNWRWMFIIEGLPAIVWAIVAWLPATDYPARARWLTEAEKAALERTMEQEQGETIPVRNYPAMFSSPKVLLLCLQYACWSAGVFGFVLWLPSILKNGRTMGIVLAGWLTAAPYLLAIIAMLLVSHCSRESLQRKAYVWGSLFTAGLAFAGLFVSGPGNYDLSYGLLILAGAAMYAPYGAYWAIVAELLPKHVRGGAMAMVNCAGALGGFVGSYLIGYLNDAINGPGMAYLLLAGAMILSGAIMFWLTVPVRDDASAGVS